MSELDNRDLNEETKKEAPEENKGSDRPEEVKAYYEPFGGRSRDNGEEQENIPKRPRGSRRSFLPLWRAAAWGAFAARPSLG